MDTETDTDTLVTGNGYAEDAAHHFMPQPQGGMPDMDGLTASLKSRIEEDGNFKETLNVMADTYRHCQGVEFFEAKNTIKEAFFDREGMTPKEYMDKCYSQRPNYGNGNGNRQNGRANGSGRSSR